MKKIIIVLFSSLALTACGQTQKGDQIKTQNLEKMQNETILKPIKALIEAMQTENAELIRAQFSKTATQAYGAEGTMKTADETRRWIESDIISRQGKVANPQYTVINENQAVVKGQYSSEGYTNKADFLFTVEDGLITAWRMRY
ncbi:nuclear transport factor 2 family protein [Flavobacterium sp. CBA20B-1]|uniref:nuclear transport factor 2 family protein n=1 Tax=unclassified Flavobacterium TaxID=196869 RepID=UPI002224F3AF|nr:MULTISPECIES: nuclear transport factor 2 family protein [unclassified Flavobacterium]WCM42043.1 nuclear transport factor 2 family protein [Flavobacterium sp. CBA20B-1]